MIAPSQRICSLLLVFTCQLYHFLGEEKAGSHVFDIDIHLDGEALVLAFRPSDDLWVIAEEFVRKYNVKGVPGDESCDSSFCFSAKLVEAMEARLLAENVMPESTTPSNDQGMLDETKSSDSLTQPYHPWLVSYLKSAHAREAQVHPEHKTFNHFDLANVEVGRATYGWDGIIIRGSSPPNLRIGSYSSIGPNVEVFLSNEHRTDWATTYPFTTFHPNAQGIPGSPFGKGDVVIGSDCWIGAGATILSGVTIGDGAVVGARAVVSKDVPPYAIVVGSPAKVVRKRFDDDTVARLLAVRWWDLPRPVVDHLVPLLSSPNLGAFLSAAEETAAALAAAAASPTAAVPGSAS